jgi:hypothetical protein
MFARVNAIGLSKDSYVITMLVIIRAAVRITHEWYGLRMDQPALPSDELLDFRGPLKGVNKQYTRSEPLTFA